MVLLKYVGGGELIQPAAPSSKPMDNPTPSQEEEEPQQQGVVLYTQLYCNVTSPNMHRIECTTEYFCGGLVCH